MHAACESTFQSKCADFVVSRTLLASGLVSHVLHRCFEVRFEAVHWSVISLSLPLSAV